VNTPPIFQQALRFSNAYAHVIPLGLQHVPGLLPFALDPELWRYTRANLRSEDDLIEYVDLAVAERRAAQSYPFAIVDAATGAVAGSTRLCAFSWDNDRLEIGFTWLGKPFQRSGLNRAVKFELLRFAFEQLHVERVEFKIDSRNQASRKALLGIGATEEGTLRKHMVNADGFRRDSVYFSILQVEWPSLKERVFSKYAREPAEAKRPIL